jgi:ubiquinone/menaquinone biosynthesis C-methylase UbiE
MPNRSRARELAAEYIRRGDPLGWFEALYREARDGETVVPWVDRTPNPHLIDFATTHPLVGAGKRALVIGSGLGDDAEQFAGWGFKTTAFDISQTAVEACRKRFPNSSVEYAAADLLAPPSAWSQNFDFVFEAYTFQVLPPKLRRVAIEKTAAFLNPYGMLLVVARGREETDPEGKMPWPLTRSELAAFGRLGVTEESFEDYFDNEDPPVRRFRALYRRS